MTVAEIDELRGAVIENAISLIADADLLYGNARYPRTYALSVLATEEISKLPALISCLEELARGVQPNWNDIGEFLNNHHGKLMMNQLYWASQRAPSGLDATGSAQWQAALKSAKDLNARKLSGFYVTANGGTAISPTNAINREQATFALQLARLPFNSQWDIPAIENT